MNRNDLEKMFDENFSYIETHTTFLEEKDNIKDFIFNTIMSEVLKSVIYSETEMKMFKSVNEKQFLWLNFYHENLKQKAKEKFNINL